MDPPEKFISSDRRQSSSPPLKRGHPFKCPSPTLGHDPRLTKKRGTIWKLWYSPPGGPGPQKNFNREPLLGGIPKKMAKKAGKVSQRGKRNPQWAQRTLGSKKPKSQVNKTR